MRLRSALSTEHAHKIKGERVAEGECNSEIEIGDSFGRIGESEGVLQL